MKYAMHDSKCMKRCPLDFERIISMTHIIKSSIRSLSHPIGTCIWSKYWREARRIVKVPNRDWDLNKYMANEGRTSTTCFNSSPWLLIFESTLLSPPALGIVLYHPILFNAWSKLLVCPFVSQWWQKWFFLCSQCLIYSELWLGFSWEVNDPLENQLGYMNSNRPFKPNLPNAPKPSNLLAPTRLHWTVSSLAFRILQLTHCINQYELVLS